MARKQAPARSDAEWYELISECRNSGLSDCAWCHSKSIPAGTFYSAVKRLRDKSFALPERDLNLVTPLDFTSGQDVVQIDIAEPIIHKAQTPVIPQEKYLDNSHTIEINVHGIGIKVSNEANPELLKVILSSLGGGIC